MLYSIVPPHSSSLFLSWDPKFSSASTMSLAGLTTLLWASSLLSHVAAHGIMTSVNGDRYVMM